MEEIAVVTMENLDPAARRQLGLYRHTVFVEHMKWDLPCTRLQAAEEWDQFDRDDTTHVIGYSKSRQVCGYARLLPTMRPYLLAEVFPDLSFGPLRSDPRIWELSRLTTFRDGIATDLRGMRRLMQVVFQYAICLGIRRLVGVTPVSTARLYRRLGLVLRAIGPVPADRNGLAAFSLNVNRAGLIALADR